MIFYQAGVDVLASYKLGKLAMSLEGCKQHDELVLTQARNHHITVAVVTGGGYSKDIDGVIEAHCNTFRIAKQVFSG